MYAKSVPCRKKEMLAVLLAGLGGPGGRIGKNRQNDWKACQF